jgi:hypothetical protein
MKKKPCLALHAIMSFVYPFAVIFQIIVKYGTNVFRRLLISECRYNLPVLNSVIQ